MTPVQGTRDVQQTLALYWRMRLIESEYQHSTLHIHPLVNCVRNCAGNCVGECRLCFVIFLGGCRWGRSEICRKIGGVSHYNLFIILQLRMNEMSKFHTACKVIFFCFELQKYVALKSCFTIIYYCKLCTVLYFIG
jgi:hypothetical protein